jgi:tetratricopeptide (TPR) repeat protein
MVDPSRRRSIWQVLGVYAVASWGVFQVALALRDGLGLPDRVPLYAAILLLIGLPIVLATALVQNHIARHGSLHAADRIADPTLHPEFDTGYGLDAPAPPPAPLRFLPAHLLTWRRSLLGGVAAFALLALGTLAFMGVYAARTLSATGVISDDDPVVLADFTSAHDPSLGVTITEAIRVDLQQSEVIRLAQPALIQAALKRMERADAAGLSADVARELAVREGLKAIITGDVSKVGAGYLLRAEVRSTSPDSVVALFSETAADSLQLLDAVDRLSKNLRRKAGESMKTVRGAVPLPRATTSSMPALRKYAEALRMYREDGDELRMVATLEEAVRIDTTFADAWRKIAVGLGNIGIRLEDQRSAIERAYRLRDRLSDAERYRVEGTYANMVLHDNDAMIRAYRQLLEIDPYDQVALNNIAIAFERQRRFSEAESVLTRAVYGRNMAPSITQFGNLASLQYAQGKFDAAKATADSALKTLPDAAGAVRLRARIAAAEHRWDAVDSIAEAMGAQFRESVSARANMLFDRKGAAIVEGRLDDARRFDSELSELATRLDLDAQRLVSLLNRAQSLVYAGDYAGARREVAEAMRAVPLESLAPVDRPYTQLASIYSDMGDAARADEFIRLHDRNGVSVYLDTVMLAKIQLDRRNAAAVLPVLRRIAENDVCAFCSLDLLGKAYDQLGERDSAIAIYERFLSMPDLDRLYGTGLNRGEVLARVAELHLEAGDRTRAAQRYGELVQLWRNAHPALQPRVRAAQQQLTLLMGRG